MTIAAALASPAYAAEVELKNDGFTDGGAASFQAGFVAGEIGASRFVPPPGTVQLTRVRFLFGGTGTTQDITLHVWVDSGADAPGTELFSSEYTLTGADDALQEIGLVGDSVFVSGAFRVGIELHHDELPSIARDEDGIDPTANFLFAAGLGWQKSAGLGLTGDWIVRAFVDVGAAGGPDAGTPAGTPDAASLPAPDAAAGACASNADCPVGQYCNDLQECSFDCRDNSDCGAGMTCNSLGQCVATAAGDGGGCGCALRHERSSVGAAVLVLATCAFVRRRRRHRLPAS
jgi:hypothetical protein